MSERLLKPVNILLSSSLRTRTVSRAFLNQCKGAWKGGRSYVYLLICWLVHYLVCYVITTRENYNPSLQLCVGWSWALHESFVGKFKEVMEGIKEMNSLNVSTIHYEFFLYLGWLKWAPSYNSPGKFGICRVPGLWAPAYIKLSCLYIRRKRRIHMCWKRKPRDKA